MKNEINFPLSAQTKPEYEAALKKKKDSEDNNGGKLKDLRLDEIAPGQFVGVIVMEENV